MKGKSIQYGIGIFLGMAGYRLFLKDEDWAQSLIPSAIAGVVVALVTFFYYRSKEKKA